MTPDMLPSLQITALGMGLVFGAILLLWLMMVLLTTFTADASTTLSANNASDSPEPDVATQTGFKAQAAALAVALALAEQQQSTARPLSQPPTAIVSAWQLGMRMSQHAQKGSLGRR